MSVTARRQVEVHGAETRRYRGYTFWRVGTKWLVHRTDGSRVEWGKQLLTFTAAKALVQYDLKN